LELPARLVAELLLTVLVVQEVLVVTRQLFLTMDHLLLMVEVVAVVVK
jgi:hypothetical protein